MENSKGDWFKKVCIYYIGRAARSIIPSHASASFLIPPSIVGAERKDIFGLTRDAPEDTFNFDTLFAWDPSGKTQASFEKMARTVFEFALHRYTSTVKEVAKQTDTKISYQPQGLREGVVPNDAIRLVRYQFLGESYERIASDSVEEKAEEGVTLQAVRSGVRRFADLIGVSLRSGSKGGRPRSQIK
jgi:hypothetical protein